MYNTKEKEEVLQWKERFHELQTKEETATLVQEIRAEWKQKNKEEQRAALEAFDACIVNSITRMERLHNALDAADAEKIGKVELMEILNAIEAEQHSQMAMVAMP